MFVLCSCNEETLAPEEIKSSNECQHSDEKLQLQLFFQALDSLNQSIPTAESRSLIVDLEDGSEVGLTPEFGATIVDYAGGWAGRLLGRWGGSAIGAALGNPAVACIGYVYGSHIGKVVGYELSSYIYSLIVSLEDDTWGPKSIDFYYSMQLQPSKMMDEDLKGIKNSFGIIYSPLDNQEPIISDEVSDKTISIEKCDSIGYFHNYTMYELWKNKDKYINANGIDIDLIYNDIVAYAKISGIYDEVLENLSVKVALKEMAMNLSMLTKDIIARDQSYDSLIEQNQSYLQSEYLMFDEELNIFKELIGKIGKKCTQLSQSEIDNYAAEIQLLILNSGLSPDTKYEMAASAQMIVNSALCWQQ